MRHRGHCSYLGKRSERACNLPNPSEGPGEHGRWYYRQHINHIYWPFVLKLYNRLGRSASRLDFYVYKHLGVLFPFANNHSTNIRYSRLLIATVNFDCSNHCDFVDKVSDDVEKDMVEKLNEFAGNDRVRGDSEMHAKRAIEFLECWGISVPTTCCYQIVVDSELKDLEAEVIQFFCLSGLGICYPIVNFWSHCFMAASFYHCTSPAVFKVGDKIYMGNYPGIDVFAWGKGGTANNPNDGNAGGTGNDNHAGINDQPGVDVPDEDAGNGNINEGIGGEEGGIGGEEGPGVEGKAEGEA